MKLFVHYIVNYLIELNMIDMDDAEIYYFGIAEGLLLIFNIILTLLISVILSDIKTGILFLFFLHQLDVMQEDIMPRPEKNACSGQSRFL